MYRFLRKSWLSTTTVAGLSEKETHLYQKLSKTLHPNSLQVQDISGGCGAMFRIYIESPRFVGQSLVQQHRLVNEVLKDDIKEMHGLQLTTKASPS